MTITCNADLFRIAYLATSTEETRYYLNGVFVEPHHSGTGVTMTATDRHILASIYDESATMTGPARIVQLQKPMLAKCEASKGQTMCLRVEGETAILYAKPKPDAELMPKFEIARHVGCIVDGTFPEYSRVIPKLKKGTASPGAFSSLVLARMAAIGQALVGKADGNRMLITGDNPGDPALVRFPGTDHAYGVMMPMRCENAGTNRARAKLPAWAILPEPVAEPSIQEIIEERADAYSDVAKAFEPVAA